MQINSKIIKSFYAKPVTAMQENMSAAVTGATCRIAICEVDNFTFTQVKF